MERRPSNGSSSRDRRCSPSRWTEGAVPRQLGGLRQGCGRGRGVRARFDRRRPVRRADRTAVHNFIGPRIWTVGAAGPLLRPAGWPDRAGSDPRLSCCTRTTRWSAAGWPVRGTPGTVNVRRQRRACWLVPWRSAGRPADRAVACAGGILGAAGLILRTWHGRTTRPEPMPASSTSAGWVSTPPCCARTFRLHPALHHVEAFDTFVRRRHCSLCWTSLVYPSPSGGASRVLDRGVV